MNNSDKIIYTQGNASTFARGTDGRLVYNGIDGEDKKYLIEGEGGGGGVPSALVNPDSKEPYIDISTVYGEEYNRTSITITSKTDDVNISDELKYIVVNQDNDSITPISIQTNYTYIEGYGPILEPNIEIHSKNFKVKARDENRTLFEIDAFTEWSDAFDKVVEFDNFVLNSNGENFACSIGTFNWAYENELKLGGGDTHDDDPQYDGDRTNFRFFFRLRKDSESSSELTCELVAYWSEWTEGATDWEKDEKEQVVWKAQLSKDNGLTFETMND